MPQGKKKKPAAKKEASPKKTAPAGKGAKPAVKKSSGEMTPLQARGLIEPEMAKISRLLEGKDFESIEEAQEFLDGIIGGGGTTPELKPETPLDKAQELVYDAWQASGRERVKLAKKALGICPDCADAYVGIAAENSPLIWTYLPMDKDSQAGHHDSRVMIGCSDNQSKPSRIGNNCHGRR